MLPASLLRVCFHLYESRESSGFRPPSALAAPPRERKEIREEKEHKRDKGPWKVKEKGKKKKSMSGYLLVALGVSF